MGGEILVYTAGYLAARAAILLGFGYVLFRVTRPIPARARSADGQPKFICRANAVPDDRC